MTNIVTKSNPFIPMRMPGRLVGIKNNNNNTILPIESGFIVGFIDLISYFKPRGLVLAQAVWATDQLFVLHRTDQIVDVNFMQARKNFVVDVGDIEQLIHTLQQIKKRETA